jgi:hypothetical protein
MKKIVVISTIMAFLAASLSAFSVFAAPSTLSRTWGPQLNDLQADRNFYDHFVADHKNFVNISATDQVKLQVYLARYASDLSKAQAIVNNPADAALTNTKNMSNAQINSRDQIHQSAVQNLATYLHEMRSLRVRLSQIG